MSISCEGAVQILIVIKLLITVQCSKESSIPELSSHLPGNCSAVHVSGAQQHSDGVSDDVHAILANSRHTGKAAYDTLGRYSLIGRRQIGLNLTDVSPEEVRFAQR